MLEQLPDGVLDKILSYLSIRERCGIVSFVSRAVSASVTRSITKVAFFAENIDNLPEESLKNFLAKHGSTIRKINLDLFRSTYFNESSQWRWRQAITNIAHSCTNLQEMDMMICNRHKLRDLDLENIFRSCPNLRTLKIDAHFINGHCFKKAPRLKRLEMEMCVRITDLALQSIFTRLRGLRALYVSQLLILNDKNLKNLVHSLKHLEELAIVSHPNTKYSGLSGFGLSVLSLLPLKTLLIDGLSAATDQFLGTISHGNKISTTLESLSISFCYNIGIHGLKRLATLPKLKNINLDGFKKRDISQGLIELATAGHLVRILLAEETNISADALAAIVELSPNLRVLDLTNNSKALSPEAANKWVGFWAKSGRPPLFVLTDDYLVWNSVHRPPLDKYGRMSVHILHTRLQEIDPQYISPSTALSFESPYCLPPGTLLRSLRQGNRYRLLFQSLGDAMPAKEDPSNSLATLHPSLTEVEDSPKTEFGAILPTSNEFDPFATSGDENFYNFSNFNSVIPQTISPNMMLNNVPIFVNPHLTEFSPDVLGLLLNTHAFEDGAFVGNSFAKEGLLYGQDGTVINFNIITRQTNNIQNSQIVTGIETKHTPFKNYHLWKRPAAPIKIENNVASLSTCRGIALLDHHSKRGQKQRNSSAISSTSGYRTQRSSFSEAFFEELPDLLPPILHFVVM